VDRIFGAFLAARMTSDLFEEAGMCKVAVRVKKMAGLHT
jgi:hypothetical protein